MSFPAILQQLAGANPQLNQIRNLMGMLRGAQDPNALLLQLAQQNPQLKQVLDLVRQHGGDPMAALRAEAQARGVDPEQILGLLK